MRLGVLLIGCAFIWGVSTTAAADETKMVHEPDRVVVKKSTTVDFNDVTMEGELIRPEGDYVPGRDPTHFDSLLKRRDNFLPELEKSAEGL